MKTRLFIFFISIVSLVSVSGFAADYKDFLYEVSGSCQNPSDINFRHLHANSTIGFMENGHPLQFELEVYLEPQGTYWAAYEYSEVIDVPFKGNRSMIKKGEFSGTWRVENDAILMSDIGEGRYAIFGSYLDIDMTVSSNFMEPSLRQNAIRLHRMYGNIGIRNLSINEFCKNK